MDDCIKTIKSLLNMAPNGLTFAEILKEYKEMVGKPVPFRAYQFDTIQSFLKSTNEFTANKAYDGLVRVTAKSAGKSAHIAGLVSGQVESKAAKKRRKAGKVTGSLIRPQVRNVTTATNAARNRFPMPNKPNAHLQNVRTWQNAQPLVSVGSRQNFGFPQYLRPLQNGQLFENGRLLQNVKLLQNIRLLQNIQLFQTAQLLRNVGPRQNFGSPQNARPMQSAGSRQNFGTPQNNRPLESVAPRLNFGSSQNVRPSPIIQTSPNDRSSLNVRPSTNVKTAATSERVIQTTVEPEQKQITNVSITEPKAQSMVQKSAKVDLLSRLTKKQTLMETDELQATQSAQPAAVPSYPQPTFQTTRTPETVEPAKWSIAKPTDRSIRPALMQIYRQQEQKAKIENKPADSWLQSPLGSKCTENHDLPLPIEEKKCEPTEASPSPKGLYSRLPQKKELCDAIESYNGRSRLLECFQKQKCSQNNEAKLPTKAADGSPEHPKLKLNLYSRLEAKKNTSEVDQMTQKMNGIKLMEVDSPANHENSGPKANPSMDCDQESWIRVVNKNVDNSLRVTVHF